MFNVRIEGSIIEVCENCLSYGEKIDEPRLDYKKKIISIDKTLDEDLILVENYGKIIRKTREKIGLTIEDFAKKINEKVSLIQKIEMQKLIPDDKLLTKIEKFLGINLREKYEEKPISKKGKSSELTLGDIVKVE